jgi:hypothetical protein
VRHLVVSRFDDEADHVAAEVLLTNDPIRFVLVVGLTARRPQPSGDMEQL